jgi:heptosyltransferase-2
MTAAGTPRVVVRPPNWLGDAVMALPALAAVRAHFARAHLTIAAVPAVAALFREESDVAPDTVIDLPGSKREVERVLARGQFDIGVLLPNSWRSAWQFRRAGIAERWGYRASARGVLLTRSARRPRGVIHQAELGIPVDPGRPPVLAATARSLAAADKFLAGAPRADGPLVGFAPGAAYGQAKQWPPDRVAQVAGRLIAEAGATCVLVGAGHDRDAGRAVESWFRANAPGAAGRVVNLIGRTSVGALVGVVARMDAMVANDSGAMHLAAALGTRVVAMFGPTNERVTRPIGDHHVLTRSVFCRPCMLRDCPIDHRCMKRIGVDDVFAAVSDVLARKAGR